jgi:hypothetical protein
MLDMSRQRIYEYETGRTSGGSADIPRVVELAIETLKCRAAK